VSSRLQPSDFGLPNDPTRPVIEALVGAFVMKWNAIAEVLREANEIASQPKSEAQGG